MGFSAADDSGERMTNENDQQAVGRGALSGPSPSPDPAPGAPAGRPLLSMAASTGDGTIVLEGPGIDPTGAAVSTAAVQAVFASAPAGSTLVVPGAAVIALDATLVIDRRLALRGSGELRWTAGIVSAPALRITASQSTIREVQLTNPNHLGSGTGARNIGIDIRANDVLVDGVRIVGFQNGVVNEASGEFEGTIVTNCHVVDVVGAGGGSGSPSSLGEDRGDGITIWGARAIVAGNVVAALDGTDARIGIHAEALPDFEVRAGSYPDSMFSVDGNIVSGPFRRGIAFEGVSHATASGNTVSGSTWWGIAAIDTRQTSISGNTVRWTRTADDTQGSAWAPTRGPIMLYRDTQATVVAGNVIEILGEASSAIRLEDATMPTGDTSIRHGTIDAVVSDNVVRINGGTCPSGVVLLQAVRPLVIGNRITVTAGDGRVGGVVSYLCTDAVIADNSVSGVDQANGAGIRHEGAGGVHVSGNRVAAFKVGISVVNTTAGMTVVGNTVADCATGLDTYGSSGRSRVEANRFAVSGTVHVNAQPATSFLTTRHMGTARPAGGGSGDILVGNGVLWVNDQGTWRSVKVT